jgi:hypothetical protein
MGKEPASVYPYPLSRQKTDVFKVDSLPCIKAVGTEGAQRATGAPTATLYTSAGVRSPMHGAISGYCKTQNTDQCYISPRPSSDSPADKTSSTFTVRHNRSTKILSDYKRFAQKTLVYRTFRGKAGPCPFPYTS